PTRQSSGVRCCARRRASPRFAAATWTPSNRSPRGRREDRNRTTDHASRRRGLEIALVCVAAIWGATFVTVKNAVAHAPVFEFLALRYALAGVVLTAMFWRQVIGLGRDGLLAGLLAGGFLFAGYAAQTIGLQYTRASNAGFVTGLFVVIAPILSMLFL